MGLIKIVDFGLAKSKAEGPFESDVGTHRYKAPEISAGNAYDFKVDVWSIGCTLYEMLTASPSRADRQGGVARMTQAQYKKGDIPLARRFISRCLTEDPLARPSCRELLADPFFQGRALPAEPEAEPEPAADSMSSVDAEAEAIESIQLLPSWGVDPSTVLEHGTNSSGTVESWTAEEYAVGEILNLRLPQQDTKHLIEGRALYQDLERIGAGTDGNFVHKLSDAAVETIRAWYGRERDLVGARFMDATSAQTSVAQMASSRNPGQLPDEVVAAVVRGGEATAARLPTETSEDGVPPDRSGESTGWPCAVCTLHNTAGSTHCAACDTPRGASEPVNPVSRDAARADAATMRAVEAAVAESGCLIVNPVSRDAARADAATMRAIEAAVAESGCLSDGAI